MKIVLKLFFISMLFYITLTVLTSLRTKSVSGPILIFFTRSNVVDELVLTFDVTCLEYF